MSSATNFAPSVVVPERVTAAKLSDLLQDPEESEKIAVIDVRDDGLHFHFTSLQNIILTHHRPHRRPHQELA